MNKNLRMCALSLSLLASTSLVLPKAAWGSGEGAKKELEEALGGGSQPQANIPAIVNQQNNNQGGNTYHPSVSLFVQIII